MWIHVKTLLGVDNCTCSATPPGCNRDTRAPTPTAGSDAIPIPMAPLGFSLKVTSLLDADAVHITTLHIKVSYVIATYH